VYGILKKEPPHSRIIKRTLSESPVLDVFLCPIPKTLCNSSTKEGFASHKANFVSAVEDMPKKHAEIDHCWTSVTIRIQQAREGLKK
jgi:hypothetical protein